MDTQNGKDFLEHHGILGMKWGIRRYQNKDGSLTPAGKKRVQKLKDEYNEITGKRLIRSKSKEKSSKIENKEEDLDKIPIRKMSDEQLTSRINRLSTEKRANELESEMRTSKGKKILSTFGKAVLAPAAIEAGRNALSKFFYKYAEETLGLTAQDRKNASDIYNTLKRDADMAEFRNRKDIAERQLKERALKDKREKEKKIKSSYTITNQGSIFNGKTFVQNGNGFKEYNEPSNSTALLSSKKRGYDWLKNVYDDIW